MPDPQQARSRQIVALALLASAVILGGAAILIYAGILDFVAADVRGLVAMGLGAVAVLDFIIGLVFFRMGQSA